MSQKAIHILYMEDNVGVAMLVKKKLENSGYRVDLAHSAKEGLSMLESNDYNLLAIDETLPDQKGREVIISLASTGSLPPTIMITGTGNETLAKEMIKLGVSDYVVKGRKKGFLASLPKVIEKVLKEHRLKEEKRKAVSSLKESEASYRSTFEYVPVGLFRIDPQGVITKANPRLMEVLECADYKTSRIELSDRFANPKDRKRWRKVLKRRGSVRDFEVQIQWQDKAARWVEISVQQVRGENEEVLYYEGCVKDITEHWNVKQQLKTMLEEVKDRQQNVVQQERLLALGQIAAGMAHDINNALSPILGYSELLLCQGDWDSGTERKLKSIAGCASDIAATVSHLHNFYRKKVDRDNLGPLKIADLVEETVRCTRPHWRDMQQERGLEVRVHMDFPEDLPCILGLESELRQVMTNLIFNAVEAMPQGGNIFISGSVKDDWLVLKVIDTGIGMSDEVHQHCLEPFFTTKIKRGAGMGLSVAYGIINRHQGQIDVESTLGEGTTVILRFPVTDKKREIGDKMPAKAKSVKILCIDDESVVRDFLKDTLSFLGYSCEIKSGGQEGIDAFAKNEFDMVITDLGMPNVDGRAVASAIKKQSPDTPVILLTGWGVSIRAYDEIPPEVDYLLDKPIKPRELQQALMQALMKD